MPFDRMPSDLISAGLMARDRVLPVHEALAPFFENSGLVRGQTVACVGSAAISCAFAVLAEPTRTGSWAAIVGLPSVGILAADTAGVCLERVVFVDRPEIESRHSISRDLAGALAALVDGMDLIVLARRFVTAASPSLIRRLQTRVSSKGGVMLIIGDPGQISVDVRLSTRTQHWEGVGSGHGHLRRRLVTVRVDGRRCARSREHAMWLPDATGALAVAEPVRMQPHLVLHRTG